jgi:hypothetical protein
VELPVRVPPPQPARHLPSGTLALAPISPAATTERQPSARALGLRSGSPPNGP